MVMSYTTFLKLLIVIILTIILYPVLIILLVFVIAALAGSPLQLIELLLMIIPPAIILKYFEIKQKKQLSISQPSRSKFELFLDWVLRIYFGLAIIYLIYILPSKIIAHQLRMTFLFVVVIPLGALYLKFSNKSVKKQSINILNLEKQKK